MTQTNIEYFNSTLKLFINEIIKIYPEYNELLHEYYDELLEIDNCNDDKYVKRFMRKFSDNKEFISSKNNELFNETICFLKNIDFKELWANDKTNESIKKTIWDYLQTLFVIGDTIVSDTDRIKSLVDSLKKKRDNEPLNENINPENKELLDMIQNLSDSSLPKDSGPNEDMLSNGLIGNLAKELAGDINLDEMNLNMDDENANIGDIFGKLMSGNNPMKFMNLIQDVGKKIQTKLTDGNIDQGALLNEAQNMMGMLGNNNPLFDNLLNTAKKEMAEANPPNVQSYDNPTHDRLKKKLEARKNKK
jgi:hypothetical protein